MAGNPREHVKDKGFWDGGDAARASNRETGGRPSGFPGTRKLQRVGVRTDLEFPQQTETGNDSGGK